MASVEERVATIATIVDIAERLERIERMLERLIARTSDRDTLRQDWPSERKYHG